MEALPITIGIASLLLWAVVGLAMGSRPRLISSVLRLGMAVVFLAASILGAISFFREGAPVLLSSNWFAVSGVVFDFKISLDALASIKWLVLGFIALIAVYFDFLSDFAEGRSVGRVQASALPLLILGAFLTSLSGNLITFFVGWATLPASGFLILALGDPVRQERASSTSRQLILGMIPDLVFFSGILLIFTQLQSFQFSELAAKIGPEQEFAILLMALGVLLRGMQVPFVQLLRFSAQAKDDSHFVLTISNVFMAAALFAKLPVASYEFSSMQALALLAAVSGTVSATLALQEKDANRFFGYLTGAVASSIFVSGLIGDFHATQSISLSFTLGFTLLSVFATEGAGLGTWKKPVAFLVALIFSGLFIFSTGWSRYLEYLGLLRHGAEEAYLRWAVTGLVALSEVLLGFAVWKSYKESLGEKSSGTPKIEKTVPVVLLLIATLAFVIGGRPDAGLLGSVFFESMPSAIWFERLIPGIATDSTGAGLVDLIGSDADYWARGLVLSLCFIPMSLGLFVFFSDRPKTERLGEKIERFCSKLSFAGKDKTLLWEYIVRPAAATLGRIAADFDSKIIDPLFTDFWEKPFVKVKEFFAWFERPVIDGILVDGFAASVGKLGKILRLTQVGRTQVYFSFGIIIFIALAMSFFVRN